MRPKVQLRVWYIRMSICVWCIDMPMRLVRPYTTLSCPSAAAHRSAFSRNSYSILILHAVFFIITSTTPSCPNAAAKYNALLINVLYPLAFTFTPLSINLPTIRSLPVMAAEISGVHPHGFRIVRSAPCSNRTRTESSFPRIIAECSGVIPSKLIAFIS